MMTFYRIQLKPCCRECKFGLPDFHLKDTIRCSHVDVCSIYAKDITAEPFTESEPVWFEASELQVDGWWKCGNCGYGLIGGEKYCPECGARVKWAEEPAKKEEVLG